MTTEQTKTCAICKQPFHPTNNRQKYCPKCGEEKRKRSSALAKRRSEEREREYKKTMAVHHWECAVEIKDKTSWHLKRQSKTV